jgi:hypothetical protein
MRKDSHIDRSESISARYSYNRFWARRAQQTARAEQERRLISQVFTIILALLTISVAAVTLNREADQQRQLQDLLR